ncbi:MAG: 2Fe-2S iron-sulfur cluster binding domain-containing protein [Chloroflexi bacterium]|nr:2Fe-2S iron-sulfur cluster binding domain-containing protein [Chloroflexota bacterium]
MWHIYHSVASLPDALQILASEGDKTRIIAGGTDLMLELERGIRKGIESLVDISRVPGLEAITLDPQRRIHIGPLATHNHCAASKLLQVHATPLARACWEVGAPQIRNRGTVAGNLITASPANDTITPLAALGATVTLKSMHSERTLPILDFYTGVRKTTLQPDELLSEIILPAMKPNQHGTFLKLGLRRAQAISVVNVACVISFDESASGGDGLARIRSAAITMGAVAPTIIHAIEAEAYLEGKSLTAEVIEQAARLTAAAARPIDDIRASADYRREMVRILARRALSELKDRRTGKETLAILPADPVLLWGKNRQKETSLPASIRHVAGDVIRTTINGRERTFTDGFEKNLLRLLRENAGLTGTKEGCAEGECGACTIHLDGKAVMACLVPAPRAHGAEIVTIDGLGDLEGLHPIQEAFIRDGAVQCGYCSPGFIMSASKLLEEKPHPTRDEIAQAITGNLCRCTGYYKIVQAIEDASKVVP